MSFKPELIQMVGFRVREGHLKHFDVPTSKTKRYRFTVNNSLATVPEKKGVSVRFEVEIYQTNAKKEDLATARYVFEADYTVKNLSELLLEPEKPNSSIDKRLLISLVAITYSTVRGALITRLQGTQMDDFFLPVVDPVKLINDPQNRA